MQKLKQDSRFGIGNNLKRLRLRKGYTQVDVAAQLDLYGMNVSRVTYNKMEHNYYPIRIQELLVFKIIFDCEFNEFFEGIEYPVRVDKS
jgi:transcriptional regulator with XRE-family HTH domain